MINTAKFPLDMTTVWSCHLIVNRTLPHDGRHVRDFIDADFFIGEVLVLQFFKWTPTTNANIFLTTMVILGKC